MSLHKTALALLIISGICLSMSSCSLFHHKPKSSYKIIPVGDNNPGIIETPVVLKDTATQKVEVETGPVIPQ